MVGSNGQGLVLRQLFDLESSTYTYILGDSVTKEAILIDPVLEQVDRDLQVIDELGLKLTHALNTHCHADHITSTGKIKLLRPSVKSVISRASKAVADIHLDEGDVFKVGSIELKVIATPGHTLGCVCFYTESGGGMVFTGDALLIRGCGRTDFQGGDAGLLYDGIHSKILTLPEQTLVYPAHDYKGRTASSIAEEKAHNPRFTKNKEDFVKLMAELGLPYPKKIDIAVPANLRDGIEE